MTSFLRRLGQKTSNVKMGLSELFAPRTYDDGEIVSVNTDWWKYALNDAGYDPRKCGQLMMIYDTLINHHRLSPDDYILDLACGPGRFGRLLQLQGQRCHLVGFDLFPHTDFDRDLLKAGGYADVRSMNINGLDESVSLGRPLSCIVACNGIQWLKKERIKAFARFVRKNAADRFSIIWYDNPIKYRRDRNLVCNSPGLLIDELSEFECRQLDTARYGIVGEWRKGHYAYWLNRGAENAASLVDHS